MTFGSQILRGRLGFEFINWKSFNSVAIVLLFIAFCVSANGTQPPASVDLPPERYELCTTEAQIQALRETYGLLMVSSAPTKAAMHPGWPETLISLFTYFFTTTFGIVTLGVNPDLTKASTMFFVRSTLGFSTFVTWTISFVVIQRDRFIGGWLSALAWMNTVSLLTGVSKYKTHRAVLITIGCLIFFQVCGSFVVIVQRLAGDIGEVAYSVSNENGCVPYNGVGYLEQGARSRAFRIIQTVEFFYTILFMSFYLHVWFGFVVRSEWRNSDSANYAEHAEHIGIATTTLNLVKTVVLLLIYVPVLIYEVIIATKGMPVVISGNCMLVELDPKYGFLDSQITTYWKGLCAFTGL
jgi:hypothetical protein